MQSRKVAFVVLVAVLCCTPTFAKKKKPVLPDWVLDAHTVVVVGDPNTSVSVADPNDQVRTQNDVENALVQWGRLHPTVDMQDADLVIMVRKGRRPGPVMGGTNANDRPVIFQPGADQTRIGGQRGTAPTGTSMPTGSTMPPTPGMETGTQEDVFQVFRGHSMHPLDSAPVWQYMGRDALRGNPMPALEQFQAAVEQSEQAKKDAQKRDADKASQPADPNNSPPK